MIYAYHAMTPDMLKATDEGHAVTLKVAKPTQVEAAWVRSEPDNEQFLSPLKATHEDDRFTYYRGLLHLNPSEPVTLYTFKIIVNGQQFWLTDLGVTPYFPDREHHYRLNPTYVPAPWVMSQVFYQIFPDRFYDGDPERNVKTGEYTYQGKPVVAKNWDELPDKRQGAREFYGGDLEGIRQKLDYLQDLGVSALYLNPIFASPSSHKYDTTDYYKVDPHFGSNETFAALCHDLKKRNMRVILDAVVNHTSEQHPWFDRYGEHTEPGAYHSQSAATRDFYTFHSDDPESYHGWYGVKTLPVLNYSSPILRDLIYARDDAVLRYWLRPPYSIDGWRFDVIHMLGEGAGAQNNATYVRHFRQTLREENPQAYMLGEHFFEATQWLQGDQEDGSMNYYGFARPVTEFLAATDYTGYATRIDASDFAYLLNRARCRIPYELALSQFNLLDSHDTPRLLTQLKGDTRLMKLAVTLLFTYVGVPCIYYGDEIGLEGHGDPDCRRPFPWDESRWNHELLTHYKTLIQLRHTTLALQQGAYQQLYAEGDVFAFARQLRDEVLITIINRGNAQEIQLPVWQCGLESTPLRDVLSSEAYRAEAGELVLTVPKAHSLVLQAL
jgi:alpha-glucosidase